MDYGRAVELEGCSGGSSVGSQIRQAASQECSPRRKAVDMRCESPFYPSCSGAQA